LGLGFGLGFERQRVSPVAHRRERRAARRRARERDDLEVAHVLVVRVELARALWLLGRDQPVVG
jgi:hypothetical protein